MKGHSRKYWQDLDHKLPRQAVYIIWSSDRKSAYVGESGNWPKHRLTLSLAGCSFEIVKEFIHSTPKSERLRFEQVTIQKLRSMGIKVLNVQLGPEPPT